MLHERLLLRRVTEKDKLCYKDIINEVHAAPLLYNRVSTPAL